MVIVAKGVVILLFLQNYRGTYLRERERERNRKKREKVNKTLCYAVTILNHLIRSTINIVSHSKIHSVI